MDAKWFKIVSWHAASGVVSRGNQVKAFCGRWLTAPELVDERPANEKSCESCLRLISPR